MPEEWRTTKASDIKAGDRVRTADGTEMLVSRVDAAFFGRDDMVAFIEDTSERWFKRPVNVDADVEVLID